MQKTITDKDILKLARSNIKKGEKSIREIEKSIKKWDKIMYGTTPSQKQESDHKPTNVSDQILDIIKPVCKKVAKAIRSIFHTNNQDLPKPKIP